MSDEGERTCPLCAEEMDLTDQQLRPCKCGYQDPRGGPAETLELAKAQANCLDSYTQLIVICVWCWHHIMDMAEKDATEGRCPACRSPYDKEKIVGMAANYRTRLVAEVHMERKMKSQKAKSKTSEGRKQLSNVRVIRRNLVYIVGLPLDLADEDLLQQREYFGQYGKVLKVSMSRTAAGVVQQFPNNTCSVYITYSKEEEAIRCIQNVHGFVLEGRPLRACFGTTKYCHAWLRNMPCSNPDCVYLHEVGSQEDSFTKDEVVSAYTRSHVQQITGAATNMERRAGNVLPPPLDDCTSNTSGRPIVKNYSTVCHTRTSSPSSIIGGEIAIIFCNMSWPTNSLKLSIFHCPASSTKSATVQLLIGSGMLPISAEATPFQINESETLAMALPSSSCPLPYFPRRTLHHRLSLCYLGSQPIFIRHALFIVDKFQVDKPPPILGSMGIAWIIDFAMVTLRAKERLVAFQLDNFTLTFSTNCSKSPRQGALYQSKNSVSTVRGLPSNGSHAKPVAPPAAWGLRATNSQPAAGSLSCPAGLSKPKPDPISSTLPFSSAVAGTIPVSLHSDTKKRPPSSDGSPSIMPGAKNNSTDAPASAVEKTLSSDVSLAPVNLSTQLSSIPLAKDNCSGCCTTSNTTKSIDITTNSVSNFSPGKAITATNEEIQNLSDELSSVDLDRNAQNEHYNVTKPSSPPPDYESVKSKSMQSQGLEYSGDKFRDEIFTNAASKASISDNGVCNSKEQYDLKLDCKSEVASGYVEVEDDVTSFDSQRLKDPEVVCHSYLPRSCFPRVANHNNPNSCTVVNSGSLATDSQVGYEPLLPGSKALCNGYSEKLDSTSSYRLLHDERNDHIGRLISEAANIGRDAATDKGESSIISNILSMEFDTWGDSLLSPHNLANLLSDNTENQNGPLKKSSSWNVQTNQSRFSFARQEEPQIQTFDVNPSHGANQQYVKSRSLIQDFVDTTTDMSLDNIGFANGFPANNILESENIGSGQFFASSNKLSAVPKPQISAPPGFSVPSRPPPPGFSSHERMGQAFDSTSGNSLLDQSFLWRNSYQTPSTGNFCGAGDIEFMDPAILAVGKGRLQGALNSPTPDLQSNYTSQLNYIENEARLQLLMQRSLSPQQNHRFSEIGNTFSHLGDSYGISSRMDQPHVSNLASFPQLSLQQSRNAVMSNGNWDGWNEMQNGNMGMAELLRNERLGFNKFHRGYDDSRYQMPNSGDLYNNRTFGI
ncbi:hypothetical protein TSUD_108520 [Trifolium subterraneum]|nr:hypothetical protein TSUD_108520 [Trifolium subterraneum]